MKYKVLLTSSGTGSRLGELTRTLNKSLLKIGEEEVISRIINSYPESTEFVITIGYLGTQVKLFVKEKFPNKKISFVKIDHYEGRKSSLGYSMLKARSQINCQFIFHCNDTLVFEKIPTQYTSNWIGWSSKSNLILNEQSSYSSLIMDQGEINSINNKSQMSTEYLHIGLVGVYDYEVFFNCLYELWKFDPMNQKLNDVSVINKMIEFGYSFHPKKFSTWLDTGNLSALNNAKASISNYKSF